MAGRVLLTGISGFIGGHVALALLHAGYTVRGTHTGTTEEYGPPTGKQIVMEGITLYHFSAGKLAEMWDRYDNLAVMQQLGLTTEAEPHSPS